MGAGLTQASVALDDAKLREPAVADTVRFSAELLTAGGPDNGWYPSPTERVQIAYGADSRLQNSLALADATDSSAYTDLAALQAAWFFGLNRSEAPVYDPATGVTFDGVQTDGTVNRNSGAESTIHGLLAMIALDQRPEVAQRAQDVATQVSRTGLEVVEAETAQGGAVVTPESSWTGESSWSGSFLQLAKKEKATLGIGASPLERVVEPVLWQVEKRTAETPQSKWTQGRKQLGDLRSEVGEKGITEASGALLPQKLKKTVPAGVDSVTVEGQRGTTQVDDLLVRPVVSRLVVGGDGRTELVRNSTAAKQDTTIGEAATSGSLRVYDRDGRLLQEKRVSGETRIDLPKEGFAILVS
jgi:hypothetical protein